MRKKIILLILWTVFYLPSNLVHTQSAAQIQLLPIGFGEVVSLSSQQICIPPEEYDSILEKLELSYLKYAMTQDIINILNENYEHIKGEPECLGAGFGTIRNDFFLKNNEKIYWLQIGIEDDRHACYSLSKNSKWMV